MTTQQITQLPLQPRIPETHEHGWLVESRHSTSEGVVLYVRCATCANRRIDVQRWPHDPPVAISREAQPAAR